MPLSEILRRMRRPMGVRMRSALAAGLVVAVVVVLAGGLLLITARSVLMNTITTTATDRANQIGALLTEGNQAALTAALRPTARERSVVQVLDAAGTVVAESDAITGVPAISPLRPAAGQRADEQRRLTTERDERFRIVALGVATPAGTRTVLVAESLDTVTDGTAAVVVAMLLGLPVLALVVGAATFWFAGRSLRPVEAMRRQAATITARNLHARLPLPGSDDEIAALAATMNTMLDRIESASAAQRRFVADASHELRSPLASRSPSAWPRPAAGPRWWSATTARRSWGRTGSGSSIVSSAWTAAGPGRTAAPGWGCRSPATSWPRTAARSRSTTWPSGRRSGTACRCRPELGFHRILRDGSVALPVLNLRLVGLASPRAETSGDGPVPHEGIRCRQPPWPSGRRSSTRSG